MVQNSVRWLMNEFLWIVLQIMKSQIKVIVLIAYEEFYVWGIV